MITRLNKYRHHRGSLRGCLRRCPGGARVSAPWSFLVLFLLLFCGSRSHAQSATAKPTTADLIAVAEAEIKAFTISAERQRQKLVDEQNTIIQRLTAAEEQKRRLQQTERQLAREIEKLEHENRGLSHDLINARDRIQSLRINLDMETPPALAAVFQQDFEDFDADTNTDFANLANRFRKIANLANRLLLASSTLEFRSLDASLPNGRVVTGSTVSMGPVTFFSPENPLDTSGWLVARHNARMPAVLAPESKAAQNAVRSWMQEGTETRLPVDPSGGKALAMLGSRSTLWGHLKDGGYVMIPLGLLGLACVVITLLKLVHFHNITPANITEPVQRIVEMVGKEKPTEARSEAKKLGNPLEAVILQGIENRDTPKEQLEELMYERMLAQQPRLERLLAPLAVFASTAPLLGLLGTVTGMIRTFRLITLYGTGTAQLLSEGLSEALITFVIWYRYFLLLNSLRSELRELEAENPAFIRRITQAMQSGQPFPRAFEQEKTRQMSPFAGALNTITALVVAAPLLGLLGTVQGIIETFVVISGEMQVSASHFGGGISRALITTQIGLSAAIPGTFAVAHLRRLYHRIQNRVALLRSQLAIKNANLAISGGR